ncbi:putative zinc-binding metallopeptidase [Ensifer sp. ENS09]|nr:putative zinc-binding metallopeptidase [Ensifer sp. ENS09]
MQEPLPDGRLWTMRAATMAFIGALGGASGREICASTNLRERNDHAGPPVNWQGNFISAYASCDPSEDIAKSPANLFHIVDARNDKILWTVDRHDELEAEGD